jgi:hypothetical protein
LPKLIDKIGPRNLRCVVSHISLDQPKEVSLTFNYSAELNKPGLYSIKFFMLPIVLV